MDLRATVEDTNISDRLEATDPLRQFCRHAFELRDWLLGSPDVDPVAKTAIEQLFGKPSKNPAKRVPAKSVALAACADIANASKHFALNRPSFSEGGYAKITSESMSSLTDLPAFARIDDVPRFGEHQWQWWITINGVEHDALMLAENAMNDWTACLEGWAGEVPPERVDFPQSQRGQLTSYCGIRLWQFSTVLVELINLLMRQQDSCLLVIGEGLRNAVHSGSYSLNKR